MVKIRNIYQIDRLGLSSVVVLLGVLAGYVVGSESILFTTSSRLAEYADRLVHHEEELTAEIMSTIGQANSSPFPPCSDEDIVLLRRLTFSARFLKDVGRLHEDSFLCSATTGRIDAPVRLSQPDFTLPSGAMIFRDYPLKVPAGDHGEIAAFGNADVVVGPDIFSDFPQQPIHYLAGFVSTSKSNGSRDFPLLQTANAPPVPSRVLESGAMLRVAGTLYRARCSDPYPVCAVASVPADEIWRYNRGLLFGYMGSGGAAGICCGTVLMVAGRKRRSHASQLKRAILAGGLSVDYQPIVELGSHRIVGAEALARWIDEDGESIRSETILALAEAEGIACEITRFVLSRALKEMRPIFESRPDFQLNINLTPDDLTNPHLLRLLESG
jgi:sensor c-di-GMP phosphodiesterase-like protein